MFIRKSLVVVRDSWFRQQVLTHTSGTAVGRGWTQVVSRPAQSGPLIFKPAVKSVNATMSLPSSVKREHVITDMRHTAAVITLFYLLMC